MMRRSCGGRGGRTDCASVGQMVLSETRRPPGGGNASQSGTPVLVTGQPGEGVQCGYSWGLLDGRESRPRDGTSG